MHLLLFMKLMLIGLFIGVICPPVFAKDSCFEWFLDQKIKPEITKQSCETVCTTASTDMTTFDCTDKCDDFCANKKCRPIWSQNKIDKSCQPMNNQLREKIIETANSENFKKLKYESPPKSELATDCSHLVQSIYSAAGLRYPYQPSEATECVFSFREISKDDLKKGDLVVFKKHIGIYAGDGKVISATVGGRRRLATLDPDSVDFVPSIQTLKMAAFGTPIQFLSWECNK